MFRLDIVFSAVFWTFKTILMESNIMILKWIKVLEGLLHLDLVKIGSKHKGGKNNYLSIQKAIFH